MTLELQNEKIKSIIRQLSINTGNDLQFLGDVKLLLIEMGHLGSVDLVCDAITHLAAAKVELNKILINGLE